MISGWDPFNWTDPENYLEVFLGPAIYYLSSLISLFALEMLISKTTSHKISTFIRVNNMGSMFGIQGYFMIPIGIGIFSIYNKSTGDRVIVIPILAFYLGFTILIGFLGFYITWCDPTPENDTELEEWYEYTNQMTIPFYKWIMIYIFIYFMGSTLFPALLAILSKFVIPNNPISSYFFNVDSGALDYIQEVLIFFPGPLLHTITFIIYYWHPIRIKMNLYLLKERSEITEEKINANHKNNDVKDDNNNKKDRSIKLLRELDKQFTHTSPWIRFPILILLVQLFVIFSFEGIQASTSWKSFIIIYSFWIWLFYLNMFIISYLGKRFGLVKS